MSKTPVLKTKHRAVGPRKGTGALHVKRVKVRDTPKKRRKDGTTSAAYQHIGRTLWDALAAAPLRRSEPLRFEIRTDREEP